MMRKILMALAAAATLAGGIAATTAPAEAKVRVFLGFGSPGYYDPGYYDPGYYDPGYFEDEYNAPVYRVRHRSHHRVHCHWRKVWHHHRLIRVKQCHRNHHNYGY
jgi:hypothetical protein